MILVQKNLIVITKLVIIYALGKSMAIISFIPSGFAWWFLVKHAKLLNETCVKLRVFPIDFFIHISLLKVLKAFILWFTNK